MRSAQKVVDAQFEVVQGTRPLRRPPWYVRLLLTVLGALGQTFCVGVVALIVGWIAIFGFGASDNALRYLKGPVIGLGMMLGVAIWSWIGGLVARHQIVDRLRRSSRAELRK